MSTKTTTAAARTSAGSQQPIPFRKVFVAWLVGFAAAAAYAAIRYVPAAGWTVHDVTAGESAAYPNLQPRLYDASPENATVVTAAVASKVLGWHVIRTDVAGRTVTISAPGALHLGVDDIQVHVLPAGPGGRSSRVIIQSQSRVPVGDLGQNARHIHDLQTAMDDKLPTLNP